MCLCQCWGQTKSSSSLRAEGLRLLSCVLGSASSSLSQTDLCMVALSLCLPVAQHVLHCCHVMGDHATHVVHQPTDLRTGWQGSREHQQNQPVVATAAAHQSGPHHQGLRDILW